MSVSSSFAMPYIASGPAHVESVVLPAATAALVYIASNVAWTVGVSRKRSDDRLEGITARLTEHHQKPRQRRPGG